MCVSNRQRGFSLIETMVAAAILAVVASAVVSVVGFAAREAGNARIRSVAAANARESLDRIFQAVQTATHHFATDAELCALLRSAGGPMDAGVPAIVTSNACPDLTVTGIPIAQTPLTRDVAIQAVATVPRTLNVQVTINGLYVGGVAKPYVTRATMVRP
jgi:prepilin-type N-terminal cleavage/methylation domain-containing protein